MFNSYFQSVYNRQSTSAILEFDDKNLDTLDSINISHDSIQSILAKIDITKSRGPDELPPCLFRNTTTLAKSLSIIFQRSMDTGTFPDAWKISKVSPLYKADRRRSVTNYRPISLPNIPSKVFEKCIFDSVYSFVSPSSAQRTVRFSEETIYSSTTSRLSGPCL